MHAVDGVSFDLDAGETLGARRRIGLRQDHDRPLHPAPDRADLGRGVVRGQGRHRARARTSCARCARDMQIIFQDPYASLNPRMTVGAIVGEALIDPQAGEDRAPSTRTRIVELLETVGLQRRPHAPLPARVLRRPAPAHRHRARARGEPEARSSATSRCRRSTSRSRRRSSTCSRTCRSKFGLTYLFIAHDLSVVEHISDRVAVMYLGRIVEIAPAQRALRAAAASVHRGAAVGGADPRPARSSASASCCRATCRARSTRRRAATSTPAARSPGNRA